MDFTGLSAFALTPLLDDRLDEAAYITIIEKLRAAGAKVNISLTLFEPQGKGAREKLAAEGITLHSIIPGPVGNY